jgi:hypothetical protein
MCIVNTLHELQRRAILYTSEQTVTYEKKIGDVVCVIKSESIPDTKLDMVDAIIALIKRELEHGNRDSEKI